MDKSHAILIRKTRLTDTSLIVSWCTPEHGLIKTVARAALRPTSPFAGRLDLFYQAEIVFSRSRKADSDLHNLREVNVTDHRTAIGKSYRRTLAASYLIKLIELAAEKETPIPILHDLLTLALDHLISHDPSKKLLHRFEFRLATYLGLDPTEESTAAANIHALYNRLPPQRQDLLDLLEK
ncbi:MAG: DNA repair protein RecO [Verrucomicrobiales bacterium]|nr:DNA repair protein RecO [Verrucomicrobiales bacterium]